MVNVPAVALLPIIIIALVFLFLFFRTKNSLRKRNDISEAIWKIDRIILNTLDFEKVVDSIVNAALIELSKYGYVILVLSLLDEPKGILKRISISRTDEAAQALRFSPIPFNSIEIPILAKENASVKAMSEKSPQVVDNLADLLAPVISPVLSLEAQKASGIKASIVYPVSIRGKTIGTLIFSTKRARGDITEYECEIMSGFVDAVGIAIENSNLFQSLRVTAKKLEGANKRLEELDKLKDDFVSIASHELRTPMTAIRSYVWMALNKADIPLSDKMKKYLERTLLSTERLINLVNDMLNVSRIESGRVEVKPVPFSMQELADEVMAEVAPKATEKQINLQSLKVKVPEVFADKDKVHQVLLNLVGNALKFTPESGSIIISFFTDGQVVETAVKDSGVGISSEDMTKLFQKFERLDNSYVAAATSGGTGLGLFISKSLIELMGGKIWAKSEGVGKGTTFSFSLPAAIPSVLAQAEKYTRKVEGEAKTLEPVAI